LRTGGLGGGGNAATNSVAAVAGTSNTGGGGGGGTGTDSGSGLTGIYRGANGGSGVVIVSYPGTTQRATGGSVSISGGYVIHTFTTSGTYVA
jgi:hypothetical protein